MSTSAFVDCMSGRELRGNAACLVREGSDIAGIVTRYDVVRTLTGAAG